MVLRGLTPECGEWGIIKGVKGTHYSLYPLNIDKKFSVAVYTAVDNYKKLTTCFKIIKIISPQNLRISCGQLYNNLSFTK